MGFSQAQCMAAHRRGIFYSSVILSFECRCFDRSELYSFCRTFTQLNAGQYFVYKKETLLNIFVRLATKPSKNILIILYFFYSANINKTIHSEIQYIFSYIAPSFPTRKNRTKNPTTHTQTERFPFTQTGV